ncbi:MAG: hypothetical protein KF892_24165 [Rhizobacter sp.]|nr:hypothetical protein [Rhizobacter sp.]
MSTQPSSVSRRLASCLSAYQKHDYETALIHFFPALDKVAKRRRPKEGVGSRIRAFLKDEEVLISAVGTGNAFSGANFNGTTFEEAIYKFGRTAIAHEGELDPRLKFVDEGAWSIGEVWELPSKYILGLCVALIVSPECKGEHIASDAAVTIFNRVWKLNELWGAEQAVKAHIASTFMNPNLFSQ